MVISNLLQQTSQEDCPIGWDCRIYQLYLCKGVKPPPTHPNVCPEYDTKLSDGGAPVLELWGIWSIPPLSLLPDPL